MRVTALVLLVGCAASSTSSSDEALTCDVGAPGSLANACEKASQPTPIKAQALATTTQPPTVYPDDVAYGVHLVAGPSGNEGVVDVYIDVAGDYEIYLGTPNIPFKVIYDTGPNRTEATPGCSSTISSTECSYLRRATAYTLNRGYYRLEFGPTTTSSYVRLAIQSKIPTAPVCTAGELTEESAVCSAATGTTTPLTAVTLESANAPGIALDTIYTVTLPAASSGYAGAFSFTPPSDGDYELYLGTPNLPFRAPGAMMDCSIYIPSTDCAAFRRGDRFTLHGGTAYRFELGPSASSHYVRVTMRKAAVTQGGTVKLAYAQQFSTTGGAAYLGAGDFDGDGAVDLEISNGDDAGGISNITLAQNSRGSFAVVGSVSTSLPAQTVVADFSGDGRPDIVGIANDGQGPLPEFYLVNQGGFSFTKQTWGNSVDYGPHISAGDFDEDGTPDVVAAWWDTQFSSGGGFIITKMPTFATLQSETAFGAETLQAVAGDFDGDGHQDVIAASSTQPALELYRGNGTGTVTFTSDIALPAGTIGHIAAFDLDRDGKSDLVAIQGKTVTISYGTATGLSAPQTVFVGTSGYYTDIVAADFDHDGRLDLAISGANSNDGIAIFLATATGWSAPTYLDPPGGSGGMATADFNHDGFADLATGTVQAVNVYLSTP